MEIEITINGLPQGERFNRPTLFRTIMTVPHLPESDVRSVVLRALAEIASRDAAMQTEVAS